MKKGSLLYGQSGGPSAVINASAYGAIKEALNHDMIEDILVMHHGIEGALEDDLYHVQDFIEQIDLLPKTPASAFGSCRYKLKSHLEDDTDLKKLVEIFKKYNIRYFLYNGGNDSMDTCVKVDSYCKEIGYDINVIGIPKTVDNDLPQTDHTPGFGSAAKYIINTIMQVSLDSKVYKTGKVTIIEIMGRHAGWLTAASYVASVEGHGPDLIYLPETVFDLDDFIKEVEKVYSQNQNCLIAVSEGVRTKDGEFVGAMNALVDSFGHKQLGGVCNVLGQMIQEKLGYKYRAIELSTVQRSASFMRSKNDVLEAIEAGRFATRSALDGASGKMVTLQRRSNDPYQIEYVLQNVYEIANQEKVIPASMIDARNHKMTQEFLDYIYPLIEGGYKQVYSRGTQDFFQIKR